MKDIIVLGKGFAGTLTAVELVHHHDVLLLIEGNQPLPVEKEGINKGVDAQHQDNWLQKMVARYQKFQLITETAIIAIEPLTKDLGYRLTAKTHDNVWTIDTAMVVNYSGDPIPGIEKIDTIFLFDISELRYSATKIQDISQEAGKKLILRTQAKELIEQIKQNLLPLPYPLTTEQLDNCLYVALQSDIINTINSENYGEDHNAAIDQLSQIALAHLWTTHKQQKPMTLSSPEKKCLIHLATSLQQVATNLPTLRLIGRVTAVENKLLVQLFNKLLAPQITVTGIQQTNNQRDNSHFCFKQEGKTSRELLRIVLGRLGECLNQMDPGYLLVYHYLLQSLGKTPSRDIPNVHFHQNHLTRPNLDLTASVALLLALSASSSLSDMQNITDKWSNEPFTPSEDWQKLTKKFNLAPTDEAQQQPGI